MWNGEESGRERRVLGRGKSTRQLERSLEAEGTGRQSQCGWSPEREWVRRVGRGEWVCLHLRNYGNILEEFEKRCDLPRYVFLNSLWLLCAGL